MRKIGIISMNKELTLKKTVLHNQSACRLDVMGVIRVVTDSN